MYSLKRRVFINEINATERLSNMFLKQMLQRVKSNLSFVLAEVKSTLGTEKPWNI